MRDLTKEEILSWCNKYDAEEDQWDPRLETRLGERFRTNKEMTKEDLIQVVRWKFATNKHRLKRVSSLIEEVEDSEIRQLSRSAFKTDDELLRVKNLMKIRGVGNAVASAILTFYDPKNYGVFDIHIYDELFGTTPETRPSGMFADPKFYIKLLEKLRGIAVKHDLDVRVVEKAYFKKNLDKGK